MLCPCNGRYTEPGVFPPHPAKYVLVFDTWAELACEFHKNQVLLRIALSTVTVETL